MPNTAKKKPTPQKKKKFCTESNCSSEVSSHGYCRLHYIAHWKHIKLNQHVKAEQRLNSYVDALAKKYPDEYMEKIKENLEDDDKFKATVQELDLEAEPGQNSETDKEFLEKFLRDIKGEFE